MTKNALVTLKHAAAPKVTLIWLPHAGGSAAFFQEMSNALPATIECLSGEYPGRGRRIREPRSDDLTHIVGDIARSLALLPNDRPVVLFGHSMGARVGFEACRKLRDMRSHVVPKLLIASACEPLHVERVLPLFHKMSDDQLLDALMSMNENASPTNLQREFLRANLNLIRSDLYIGETHRFIKFPISDQRLLIYGGTRDNIVRHRLLEDWRHLSTTDTKFRAFEGGHFYFMQRPTEFLSRLCRDIYHAIGEEIPTLSVIPVSEIDPPL